jgi:uncharacterized membrane protein (DUF485 family)
VDARSVPGPPDPDTSDHDASSDRSDGPAVRWSPWRTRGARLSWGLLMPFAILYFVTAILTSAEFADLAAATVFGLPLGFLLGALLIIVGLVITRLYLSRGEG